MATAAALSSTPFEQEEQQLPSFDGIAPTTHRWMFNPFAVVDLTNLPTSCGVPFLKPGTFTKIGNINIYPAINDPFMLPPFAAGGGVHNPSNYTAVQRVALHIAMELEAKYGETGVIEVKQLAGASAETVRGISSVLLGDQVEAVIDDNFPSLPCPVLPTMAERLQQVRKSLKAKDQATQITREVCDALLTGINNAIAYCRAQIADAHQRFLTQNAPNRKFSAVEQRCFLALGQEVPNQLPLVSETPQSAVAAIAQAFSTALGSVVSGTGGAAAEAPEPAKQPEKTTITFEKEDDEGDEDVENAAGTNLAEVLKAKVRQEAAAVKKQSQDVGKKGKK